MAFVAGAGGDRNLIAFDGARWSGFQLFRPLLALKTPSATGHQVCRRGKRPRRVLSWRGRFVSACAKKFVGEAGPMRRP
jgi:predicted membrane metal-binding protein